MFYKFHKKFLIQNDDKLFLQIRKKRCDVSKKKSRRKFGKNESQLRDLNP